MYTYIYTRMHQLILISEVHVVTENLRSSPSKKILEGTMAEDAFHFINNINFYLDQINDVWSNYPN